MDDKPRSLNYDFKPHAENIDQLAGLNRKMLSIIHIS